MLTPQEVSEKSFSKATFSGYNMAQVDEFLDALTVDYGVLYSDNAVLKSKMKVMVDKVDEYRSTEEAMRKALMSAQRMADELIQNAEEQRRIMLAEAEAMALAKVSSIRDERSAEEFRLAEVQRAVLEFTAQAKATYQRNLEYLDQLATLCPAAPVAAPEHPPIDVVDEVVEDIEENVLRILEQTQAEVAAAMAEERQPNPQSEPYIEEEDLDEELDFSALEFGDNYQHR